jgi:hypothetical protein
MRLAAIVLLALVASAPTAPAEDVGGLPGFFQHLFGGGAKPPEPPPAPKPRPKKPRDFVPSSATRAPGTPGGAPVQASYFVDVLGDSLAVSVADGLVDAFADKPEIGVRNKARDASGLVAESYFDWKKAAADIAVAKDHPDFVVILLGINELQALREGNDAFDPLSDKWKEKYGQRVEAMLEPFRAAHIPALWVGLPPMRAERFNSLAIALNAIFKAHAEKAGAKFIDIWDDFANQDGLFDAFGPNVEGQNVKLRGPDGILFTKAGGRKAAHFLEAEIRHAFERKNPAAEVANLPPDIEQAADDINAQIRREMGAPAPSPAPAPTGQPAGVAAAPPPPPPRPEAGPILSLTARPVAPGGVLASLESARQTGGPAVEKVLRRGQPTDPAPGRADDFVWPRM